MDVKLYATVMAKGSGLTTRFHALEVFRIKFQMREQKITGRV